MKKTKLMPLLIIALMAIATISVSLPQAAATTPSVLTSSPSATTPASGGWSFPTFAFADSTGSLGNTNSAGTNVVGRQQSYYGYGISVPTSATISSVMIRIDAASTTASNIKIEVSLDGGSTFLSSFDEKTISTTATGSTFYTDITSWTTWTSANLNQIMVRVTLTTAGLVWLDWIPITVTYSSTINSPSLTEPTVYTTASWGNPEGAYSPSTSISGTTAAYVAPGTLGALQKYHGYGFTIPPSDTIISVRVRLDAKTFVPSTSGITVKVSTDGGANYLPSSQEITVSGTSANPSPLTNWIDITSWKTWTPSDLNNDQIWVMVTHTGVDNSVYIDWIPVEVTYGPSFVVPEYALGGLGALAVTFAALIVFMKRSSIPGFKRP